MRNIFFVNFKIQEVKRKKKAIFFRTIALIYFVYTFNLSISGKKKKSNGTNVILIPKIERCFLVVYRIHLLNHDYLFSRAGKFTMAIFSQTNSLRTLFWNIHVNKKKKVQFRERETIFSLLLLPYTTKSLLDTHTRAHCSHFPFWFSLKTRRDRALRLAL